jgi:hypothetical protein
MNVEGTKTKYCVWELHVLEQIVLFFYENDLTGESMGILGFLHKKPRQSI